MVCYGGGLLCGIFGARLIQVSNELARHAMAETDTMRTIMLEIGRKDGETAAHFIFAAVIILMIAYLAQFIFLGIWNPLKLVKKSPTHS